MRSSRLVTVALLLAPLLSPVLAEEMPRIEGKDGRFALIVDGKPFFVLGAQINNSSSWSTSMPKVWPALESMHVNTVEAPVYWEVMEPQPGHFDFANVDLLVNGAREHHLRLVLLWFGTWKNGQAHYVPEWIKGDTAKYPRELNSHGKLLDVLSPSSDENLEADKHAFAALMRHVKEIDGAQHTVIMIQVENESGSVGSVRDYSPAAEKDFAALVPPAVSAALHTPKGSWTEAFGADADESFAAYSTARYINEVARAGKAEYPLPMYCNVWITYPVHALDNRDRPSAGQEYPSGGPQQQNIAMWKAVAPSIDILAPDYYSDDAALFRQVIAAYHRPNNPLFIPEVHFDATLSRYFFYALGNGAIGFSPFGVDYTGYVFSGDKIHEGLSENFALFHPMVERIGQLNLQGNIQTAVEEKGTQRQTLRFGNVEAIISFGFPQRDGEMPPGTADLHGRAMVAQTGPLEFLVTGFDASVSFQIAPVPPPRNQQLEILRAEEGQFVDGAWQMNRIWNGDQTDRGLNFRSGNTNVVKIRLHTMPLYDERTGGTSRK